MSNFTLPTDYQQTLLQIKDRINQARFLSLRTINAEMILMYLEIGKVISAKVTAGWGDFIVDKFSIDLQIEFPGVKGFSLRNIRRMKYIYERCLEHAILPQAVARLPWGHLDYIFTKIKKTDEILFYLQKSVATTSDGSCYLHLHATTR